MGQPAAKMNDLIVNPGDLHIVINAESGAPVTEPLPFQGPIVQGVCPSVRIDGQFAAVVGSGATNVPPHIPIDGSFSVPPTNQGSIVMGSATVRFAGRAAARAGDPCETCHDVPPGGPQAPLPMVVVQTPTSVLIG
ncbi:hypothetical protein ASE86_11270 [Sphingomonas sp. Leaf33]|uniref:PAAR domain-containing protein n=1 Tax=Sphingomonas sp. Leaf33 TaxID=1736215 RepID=UPI0006F66026|nr:PAAR domain-containing protein [Sphingomonas sp. Leaf33]KQN26646.1 hypothetical protein ASE86_11270 [Sphingomonas sp. Leaf33]